MAELNALGDGTTTSALTLTNQNTWYSLGVTGAFINNNNNFTTNKFAQTGSMGLQYIGSSTGSYNCSYSIALSVSFSSDNYQVSLFKNGSMVSGTIQIMNFQTNGSILGYSGQKIITIGTNDIIEFKVRDASNGGKVMTFNYANIMAMSSTITY